MRYAALIIFPFILFKLSFSQEILNVPADFPSIQSAIDNSTNGDTILVSPGSYQENINFNGKNIILSSYFLLSNDPSYVLSTVIDGSQSGTCVTFNNGEDSGAILTGFTLKNGGGVSTGGGAFNS